MVDVVVMSDPALTPKDARAYYVFAGHAQPAWGSLGAFQRRPTAPARFAERQWASALGQAKADASRNGIGTVYLVRGG
jgi:hypothetical protein